MRRSVGCILALAGSLACGDTAAPAEQGSRAVSTAKASASLGDLSDLQPAVRRAFASHPEDFASLPEPGPNDWLAVHPEPPQSVGHYWVAEPNKPGDEGRDVLYVLPLGEVPDAEALRSFASDFFTLKVVVLPGLDLGTLEVTRRDNGGVEQMLAPEVLAVLKARLPADAYAMIGLTMVDLYPGEDWNYVFGYASTRERTGVFSLARYDDATGAGDPSEMKMRAFKILAHEFGHMFGLAHCVHHACLMNGVNHRDELDRSPLNLCPVCLRKLHLLLGFDPAERYDALRGHYETHGFGEAEAFVARRLQWIAD